MKKKTTVKRHQIPIDFKPEVLERLKRQAEAEGLPLSTYVRSVILTSDRFLKGKK